MIVTVDVVELLEIARDLFTTTRSGQELRLIDVRAAGGELRATFAGRLGDTGGPYGVRVPIPEAPDDPAWDDFAATTRAEWVLYGVVMAAAEGYDTRDFDAPAAGSDVTWVR